MKTKRHLACSLLFLCAIPALAQSTGRDMSKEELIWKQLQATAPRSVETFKAATIALDKSDYETAARLYDEVLKQAPDMDVVLRRLGVSLVELKRREEGIALLERAVKKQRSPENLSSLAQALALGNESEASTQDAERALMMAKDAARADGETDSGYWTLVAQIASRYAKEKDLRDATLMLVTRFPDTMATHFFSALVAAADGDWIRAEEEVKQAQRLGLPPEVANSLLASGIHAQATVWHYSYYSLYLVTAWAVGLALLFVLGKLFSLLTLRWIEATDPNSASAGRFPILSSYRWLMNLAGVYYYISIPVVAFLLLAIAASVIYGFFMVGHIPIKLALILVSGAILTVYKMIRSLFIKIEVEAPGRSLRQEEAPQLWALVHEVAETVGTRPVDEIRVTPGTEMAVYERGSFKERMQDRAHRVLILGVGTLNEFGQNAFRAVLAHEYGHFSHRDTAGGDVAIRVNNDMMKFVLAMVESGQAVWWNVAFQFLRIYHFIFRRISHGATRLQEVLADRVAARIYSPAAFEEGLTHVIRSQVMFESTATREVNEALASQRAVRNLYRLEVAEGTTIEEEVSEIMNRPTSEDDTHPSPVDRFRLVRRITGANASTPSGMVWDLFTDRVALTEEMSSLINDELQGLSRDISSPSSFA